MQLVMNLKSLSKQKDTELVPVAWSEEERDGGEPVHPVGTGQGPSGVA